MKININFNFLLIIIICLIIKKINIYVVFVISIIFHELSHLIIGILIGKNPRKIEINAMGISLEFNDFRKVNLIFKILFYLIGPLVNFFIAYFFEKINDFTVPKETIIYTNYLLFIFNLLPIIPLDGGRIIFEICNEFSKDAYNIVFMISKFFLGMITFLYSIFIIKIKSVYLLLLITYLWYLFLNEEKKIKLYQKTKMIIENKIKK